MSIENLRNKIKKVTRPIEAERLPVPNLARACENPKINLPDKKENQATKVSKVIQTLMEILTDEDLKRVAEVYRGALQANQRHWVDEGKDPKTGRAMGHWEVIPDFKTRIVAANMIAAYKEGLPVQRQVVINKAFESADNAIQRIKKSPELLRAIQTLQGSGLTIEAGGEAIDIETEELR
jgi:hypothetical protein